MRMRGFVAGGLVGIAAGILLSRRKPGTVDMIVRSADRLMDACKHKVIEQALNFKFGAKEGEREASDGAESGSSWNTIRSLISADARVKHEAERILEEAGDAVSGHDKPH
jgi:hypothetical protein